MNENLPTPRRGHPPAEANGSLHPISKMVTGIAHEVRNPLGVLLMGIDCLGSKVQGDALGVRVIEDMRNAVARMDAIVSALPDLSPADRRPRQPEDVNQLIETAWRRVAAQAEAQDITVVRDFAAELPAVRLDAKKCQQAVVHLLTNAIEAMPDGGTLTLQTQPGADTITLRIEDTGGGVPAHLLAKVFDPFFSKGRTERNAGLGLTVAREIVHAHGGTIAITHAESGGAVVAVTFPACTAPAEWSESRSLAA